MKGGRKKKAEKRSATGVTGLEIRLRAGAKLVEAANP
jgi:hypothetical protein